SYLEAEFRSQSGDSSLKGVAVLRRSRSPWHRYPPTLPAYSILRFSASSIQGRTIWKVRVHAAWPRSGVRLGFNAPHQPSDPPPHLVGPGVAPPEVADPAPHAVRERAPLRLGERPLQEGGVVPLDLDL